MFAGALMLCYLPPAKSSHEKEQAFVASKESSVGIYQGMKNCYYLLTTPKFVYLTFTMFANGYIALFVPSQMNRQVKDSVSVGIFMSIYASRTSSPSSLPSVGNCI